MATQTSSLIGVDLSGAGGTTQLFALGTMATGDSASIWQYIQATSTLVTGTVVNINSAGTGKVMMTAMLTAVATGVQLGFAQSLVNQSEFAWVALHGKNLYVLVSGSLTASTNDTLVGFGPNSGRLVPSTAGTLGSTALGIYLLSSVLTSDQTPGICTNATLIWPRMSQGQ
mgnify:CR=1 FL=1